MASALEIVHVDFSPVWRGGQQQLLLLARELRARGCRQTVVARPGVVMQRMQAEEGWEVMAPGASAIGRARHADVVHGHDGHAHNWLLRATWNHHGRRVLSRRVAFPIRGMWSRWKYRHLDLAITVSAFVRAQVEAAGMARERITVIPDGIALNELPAAGWARQRVRAHCGLDEATPCLVCLGALTAEKGVGDAIAALGELAPPTRLLVPSSGPLLRTLQQQARALGCAERVRFGGGEAFSAAEWVAAADVLLMPSRAEGLGSAALLAMALERPVVATRAGGIPELIEDEVTGLLAPAGAASALAACCRRLLQDAALAARLVAAAREQVASRYSAAQVGAATLAAYETAVGAP
ncbi:MAG: glycosyltransferase family 4 protein [Terriglobales bacterium]